MVISRIRSLLVGTLWLQCAVAQQCFYPDGTGVTAESVHQCSSNGGVCCPQNWDCLSNGLCSNKAANIIGRYSCTDKSWGKSCPNFCLDNGSMGGDQAVLQCSDGRYCCDADRVSFNCCSNGAEHFDLSDGGTGSMTSSGPTSSAQSSSSSSPPSSSSSSAAPTSSSKPSSSPPSDSSASSSSVTSKANNAASRSSTTSLVISATSASVISMSGRPESTVMITTVFTTAIQTPAAAAESDPSTPPPSHSNKTGLIVGLAVGIPLGLALLLIPLLILCFRRHRRRSLIARERRREEVADAYSPGYKDSAPDTPATPEFANGAQYYSAKHVRAPSEIDSRTLGLHPHPDMAELSAEPRTPRFPEHSGAVAGATQWQPPPKSQPKLVAGLAHSHRTPGRNPEYQPYLAELPT